MLKDFCMVLLSGVLVCYIGVFLLLLLVSWLSQWLNGSVLYSDFVIVLILSLPALLWGLWHGRPAARPRLKVARYALIFIAILVTSLMDISNTRLMLLGSLGVWSLGMIGLYFGRKLPF